MAADTFVDVQPESDDPDQIVGAYRDRVAAVLDRVDAEQVRAETGQEIDTLREELPATAIADVAAILAIDDGARPDAIRDELLDQLLIEMTTAVVDVDALAGRVPLDLSGKELQQRIEGRAPMTLREYALIRHAIGADQ